MGCLDIKKNIVIISIKKEGVNGGVVDPNIKKNDAKILSLLHFYDNKKVWRKYGKNMEKVWREFECFVNFLNPSSIQCNYLASEISIFIGKMINKICYFFRFAKAGHWYFIDEMN